MRSPLVVCLLVLAACSSPAPSSSGGSAPSSGGSSGPSSSGPATSAPSGAGVLGVGPVQVDVPAGMVPFPVTAAAGQRSGGYRSPADAQGVSGVLLLLVAEKAARSAKAEAEALVGLKRDVEKAPVVTMSAVTLPGFDSAYRVEYDDAPAVSGGASPRHGLVVVAQVASGELVDLNAVAPRATFERLGLAGAVGSLRLASASG